MGFAANGEGGVLERLVGGRYRLTEPIGRGGMGTVWSAHDELLDRVVAVKELNLPPELGSAERSVITRRTLREARAAGRLSHPGVVVVHDVIEEDRRPWIVMQLVESRSLGQVVREDGPLPPSQVADIGLQILAALRAAHRAHVLHRDVKPENVLLAEDGRVVLTDFGIAVIEEDPSLTRTGTLLGTPSYIPPERITGNTATPESDLWSLGATLYTAVEGRPAYDRGGTLPTVAAILNEDPDPAKNAGPLEPIILGLMRKDPEERLTADEAVVMLQDALRPSPPEPSRRPRSRLWPVRRGAPPAPPDGDRTVKDDPVQSTVDPTAIQDDDYNAVYDDYPTDPGDDGRTAVQSADDRTAVENADDRTAVHDADGRPAVQGAVEDDGTGAEDATPTELAEASPRPQTGLRDRLTEHALVRLQDLRRAAQSVTTRPAGRPDRPDRPSTPGRSWLPTWRGFGKWLLIVIPLAVIVALLALWLGARSADENPGSRRTGGQAPVGTPKDQAGPTQSPRGSTPSPESKIPAGWELYKDKSGFEMAVPKGWRRQGTGSEGVFNVYFRDPGSSRYVQIGHTNKPGDDPKKDWEAQERARKGSWPDFKRVRLENVDYMDKAADWEFTYGSRSGRMRALDRGFTIGDEHGYAIFWVAPDKSWKDDLEKYFKVFTATFKPAD